mgnify:CR=1 FL=1
MVELKISKKHKLFFRDIANLPDPIGRKIFEREKASINYPEGRFMMVEIMKTVYDLITDSYTELSKIIKDTSKKDNSFKGEALIKYILKEIPCGTTFTKEDIRNKYPNVSESTLNRALVALKEEGIIEIIGKGRSARWMKTNESNPIFDNVVI